MKPKFLAEKDCNLYCILRYDKIKDNEVAFENAKT